MSAFGGKAGILHLRVDHTMYASSFDTDSQQHRFSRWSSWRRCMWFPSVSTTTAAASLPGSVCFRHRGGSEPELDPAAWALVVFYAGILFDMVGLEGWNLAYESSVLLSAVFARPPRQRVAGSMPRRQEAWLH